MRRAAKEAAVCLGVVFVWLLVGTAIGVLLDIRDGNHTGIIYVIGAWIISAVLALVHVAIRVARFVARG
jgi:hypothetical protein